MTTLTRWDPLRESATLRTGMDRLFDEAFGRSLGISALGHSRSARPTTLSIDLYEDGTEFVITAAVPGIDPEDVEISVDDDLLTIKGESHSKAEEGATYHRRELRQGSFQRVLHLPPTVDAQGATAEFEHGLLKLTIPKRPESRSKSFKITPSGMVDAEPDKD